jgi:hypothetical protein
VGNPPRLAAHAHCLKKDFDAKAQRKRKEKQKINQSTIQPIIQSTIIYLQSPTTGVHDMERTFIIIKPDAVQRGLVGEIIGRFERRGLKLSAMKFLQVDDALARQHYAVHAERPFFGGLISYITSSPWWRW